MSTIQYILIFCTALLATTVSIFGDTFIYEASKLSGFHAVKTLVVGCVIFGLSGFIWYFVFKKINFSGVILLYLFLSVIIAVVVDVVKYQNIPDTKAILGILFFFVGMWFLKDYIV